MLNRLAPLAQAVRAFGQSRVVKNCVQISMIYAAGDLTQQYFITKPKAIDLQNTKNVALVGGCVLAPLYTFWYSFLTKRFPGTTTSIILKKVIVDQIVGGTLGTALFFIMMSILEKQEDVFAELKQKFPIAYAVNIAYFPVIMIGVFKKVPVQYQPIAVACADFIWSIFLCYYKMKHNEQEEAVSLNKAKANTTTDTI